MSIAQPAAWNGNCLIREGRFDGLVRRRWLLLRFALRFRYGNNFDEEITKFPSFVKYSSECQRWGALFCGPNRADARVKAFATHV